MGGLQSWGVEYMLGKQAWRKGLFGESREESGGQRGGIVLMISSPRRGRVEVGNEGLFYFWWEWA